MSVAYRRAGSRSTRYEPSNCSNAPRTAASLFNIW